MYHSKWEITDDCKGWWLSKTKPISSTNGLSLASPEHSTPALPRSTWKRGPNWFSPNYYTTFIWGFYFIWPSYRHTSFSKNNACLCLFSCYLTAIKLVTCGAKCDHGDKQNVGPKITSLVIRLSSRWFRTRFFYNFQIIIEMYAWNLKLSPENSWPLEISGIPLEKPSEFSLVVNWNPQ